MSVRLDVPREGTPPLAATPREFAAVLDALSQGSGPFALDSERASGYRYSARAYLVQVRRAGAGTHLIDPIAIGDFAPLAELLHDDEWVLHAASQDLPCLRDLGLHPPILFDTELAGRLLGRPRVGLATMIAEEFSLELAKEHSAADWSVRPLPDGLLNYAALDVELLIELRDRLSVELERAGKADWARQEFDALLEVPQAAPSPEPWRRTSHITDVSTTRGLAVVRELWFARDELARRLDIAPGRVLPDRVIVAVASRPLAPALPDLREFRRREPAVWTAAYERALALPTSQLPARRGPGRGGLPEPRQWARVNPPAAQRLAAVRATVHDLADAHSMPQENVLQPVAQRALAWAVAGYEEAEVRELLRGAGARPWQIDLTALPLLDALRSTLRHTT